MQLRICILTVKRTQNKVTTKIYSYVLSIIWTAYNRPLSLPGVRWGWLLGVTGRKGTVAALNNSSWATNSKLKSSVSEREKRKKRGDWRCTSTRRENPPNRWKPQKPAKTMVLGWETEMALTALKRWFNIPKEPSDDEEELWRNSCLINISGMPVYSNRAESAIRCMSIELRILPSTDCRCAVLYVIKMLSASCCSSHIYGMITKPSSAWVLMII